MLQRFLKSCGSQYSPSQAALKGWFILAQKQKSCNLSHLQLSAPCKYHSVHISILLYFGFLASLFIQNFFEKMMKQEEGLLMEHTWQLMHCIKLNILDADQLMNLFYYCTTESKIHGYNVWKKHGLSIQSVVCKEGGDNGGQTNQERRQQGDIQELVFAQVAGQCDRAISNHPSQGPSLG